MTASGKADNPFRLVRQRKQPFAKGDGYRGIERAIHHESAGTDPRDALIGAELIRISSRTGANQNADAATSTMEV